MVETKSWKVSRGLAQDRRCRVCHERDENVEHIVAGCKVLVNNEYLTRHNMALMIMAVNWANEYKLVGDEMVWCKERSERGVMFENDKGKLVRDFEFSLRKTPTARRPDLIYGMPSATQHRDKKDKKTDEVHQVAFVVSLIIGALGAGMRQVAKDVGMIFENNDVTKKTICEMQKTVLMDSETTAREVLSGLIQEINK